jgi:hypothetical protein
MGQSKEIYETTLPVLSSQRTELRRELDWTVFMTEKYNTSNNQSLDSVITEFFDRMSNSGTTETSLKDINIPNEK